MSSGRRLCHGRSTEVNIVLGAVLGPAWGRSGSTSCTRLAVNNFSDTGMAWRAALPCFAQRSSARMSVERTCWVGWRI